MWFLRYRKMLPKSCRQKCVDKSQALKFPMPEISRPWKRIRNKGLKQLKHEQELFLDKTKSIGMYFEYCTDFLSFWTGSLSRESPGSQRRSFPGIPKELWLSFRPVLKALNIRGYSNVFADIEVVNLFTISSSIDSKKNYFVSSWSANAVSLEVEGLHLILSGDDKKQQKKNAHTQLQWNKNKVYSLMWMHRKSKRFFNGKISA